jgi:hypothetical protein
MKKVTLWHQQNQRGEMEFNHLEDGHVHGLRPQPKSEQQQRAWSRGVWSYEHAYLDAHSKVVLARWGKAKGN